MPRPTRPWFRVYVEMMRDPKIRRLTPEQRWVWVGILAAARESCEPGALFIAPGLPMSHRELADVCGVREREVVRVLPLMQTMSMVEVETNGLVRVLNWDHRQFESDDVTKRTRDHRERSTEQRRNVPGNAPETETETETDKEVVDKAARKASARRLPEDWEPTQKHREKERDGIDVDREAAKFRLHAEANDRRQANWNAAFSQWLLNARPTQASNVVQLPDGRVKLPPLPPSSPWGSS